MTNTVKKRFGMVLPKRPAKVISREYHREIERAIEKVKRHARPTKAARKRSQMSVSRFNFRNGKFWNEPDTSRLRFRCGDLDEARAQKRIIIRGRVPRAFFNWFENQVGTDGRDRKMLSNCFFEER